jgi:hypothetical protein
MMCALERGRPDRLPVSVHQWQPYHLDKYLGGISDIEAFEKFDMDAQIQYFADMGQFWVTKADFSKVSTSEWKDEAQIINDDTDDRDKVRREVLTKLNAARGGGFILQADHSVPDSVDPKTYDYVIELVREYGNYPLELGEFDQDI